MLLRGITHLLTLCSLCAAGTIQNYVVHERRSDIALQQWDRGQRLDSATVLPVRIGLTQTNLDKGHEILMDRSNPGSQSYAKHLNAEQVIDLFAPKDESITAVTSWLTSDGIDLSRLALSPNKQWIKFNATAGELERLLHARYHVWQHQLTLDEDVATEEYSVPSNIGQHIDYITPGTWLLSMRRPKYKVRPEIRSESGESAHTSSSLDDLKHCANRFSPQCIAATYNITEGHLAQKGNEIGFYEAFEAIFDQKDFDKFNEKFYPRIPQGFKPKYLSVDGGSLTGPVSLANGEVSLDTELGMPIAYPQGFTIWRVAQRINSTNGDLRTWKAGWFNTWLDALDGSYCNYTAFNITGDSPGIDPKYPGGKWPHPEQCGVYKPTNVISVSYGGAEAALPAAYLKRQCNEYMKLGLQGVSIFIASGDNGVEGGIGGGKNGCLGPEGNIFAPTWPSTCPYVTSVGGTTFNKGDNVLDHSLETGAGLSSGGFSNVFPAPEYQKPSVQNFLTNYPPSWKSYSTKNDENIGQNGGVYNRNGRGFPDLSSVCNNLLLVLGKGEVGTGEGTSGAAPVWAAIFNRINEERLAKGKHTIGFVNPALYAHPELMHDIVKGRNQGCLPHTHGFNVTKGWDPVTGLGSPSFPALLEYFMGLQ